MKAGLFTIPWLPRIVEYTAYYCQTNGRFFSIALRLWHWIFFKLILLVEIYDEISKINNKGCTYIRTWKCKFSHLRILHIFEISKFKFLIHADRPFYESSFRVPSFQVLRNNTKKEEGFIKVYVYIGLRKTNGKNQQKILLFTLLSLCIKVRI